MCFHSYKFKSVLHVIISKRGQNNCGPLSLHSTLSNQNTRYLVFGMQFNSIQFSLLSESRRNNLDQYLLMVLPLSERFLMIQKLFLMRWEVIMCVRNKRFGQLIIYQLRYKVTVLGIINGCCGVSKQIKPFWKYIYFILDYILQNKLYFFPFQLLTYYFNQSNTLQLQKHTSYIISFFPLPK